MRPIVAGGPRAGRRMSRVLRMERVIIRVDGRVQGVGFRWWVQHQARELGLAGYAENLPDGRVEVSAQGEHPNVNRLIRHLVEQPTSQGRPGRVTRHEIEWGLPEDTRRGFRVY